MGSSDVQRQVAFEDPGGLIASNPQAQGLRNPFERVSQNRATSTGRQGSIL